MPGMVTIQSFQDPPPRLSPPFLLKCVKRPEAQKREAESFSPLLARNPGLLPLPLLYVVVPTTRDGGRGREFSLPTCGMFFLIRSGGGGGGKRRGRGHSIMPLFFLSGGGGRGGRSGSETENIISQPIVVACKQDYDLIVLPIPIFWRMSESSSTLKKGGDFISEVTQRGHC